MIAVALCALLLALAVWTVRHVEARVRLERLLAEQARTQAERARYLAQVRSAQAALVAAKLGTTDQPKAGSLWAGLSVNHPIFKAGQTKDLRIEFTLVNDGDKEIDPKIADSRIVINGKERTDSGLIFSSVEKGMFQSVVPGRESQLVAARGPVQGARNLSNFLEGRWFRVARNHAPNLARRSPLILLDEVSSADSVLCFFKTSKPQLRVGPKAIGVTISGCRLQ